MSFRLSGNRGFAEAVTSPSWSHCEDLIRAFEEAWREGARPRIADYLWSEGETRQALLIELVHIDLEFRVKAGQSADIQDYVRSFPELAGDERVLEDLQSALAELRERLAHQAAFAKQRTADKGRTWIELGDNDTAADTPWPAVPGYEIVAQIGRGGMGIVYQARDPSLDRQVALKFLPAEYLRDGDRLARFVREAKTASALNHPHICTIHALAELAERPFIVMEFVEGRTLKQLAASRPQPMDVARWIAQAARALAAAHAAGVVHRDIKPENIMLREDGYVKVLDFGLARWLPTLAEERSDGLSDTRPGALLGTAAYMSPEQTRGAPADSASDVFSLGIVAYQLLTGRHPFEAANLVETLSAIALSPIVPAARVNPEVPLALSNLVEAMLSKDPLLRPSAEQVATALDTIEQPAAKAPSATLQRPIVRRRSALGVLRSALAAADSGRGSMVCLWGEPGIGKTTVVDDFLAELAGSANYLAARGHCSERLAATEAYLPVIDALQDVLRGESLVWAARLMKAVAPTWHALLTADSQSVAAATKESARAASQPAMVRELTKFVEQASRLATVVLFLDDVHWADLSTVDLLSHLGRNCENLRLLIITTHRPTEMLLGRHPFRHVQSELQARGMLTELALTFLSLGDIRSYLDLAFPGHAFADDFASLIHARTEGSPLFMVDLLRYLTHRGVLSDVGGRWRLAGEWPDLSRELPESVRGMIQRKLDRLDADDRQLLAAAAVQGNEFEMLIVADALGREASDVEQRLHYLDRLHGLVRMLRAHELPDRSLSIRYAFVHALYQQALYHELLPTRQAALSLTLAQAMEQRYGKGALSVAAELACLYEVGRDWLAAARQLWLASLNAARVFAHGEAVTLARRALVLLESLPASPDRTALEIDVQTTLGLQLQVTRGYATPAARQAYLAARKLCLDTAQEPTFPVLWGLWLYHKVRSELNKAQALAEELSAAAQRLNAPDLALQAYQARAMTAFCRGEQQQALRHVEQAAALYDPARHQAHAFQFGQDPGVICKAFGAVVLWLLGYPDAAVSQSDAALRMSEECSPSSRAVAYHFAAMVHQLRRDPPRVRQAAEACAEIAAEHGLSFWLAGSAIFRGWALAAAGESSGINLMRHGIADWQATGSVTYRTYYLGILAETLLQHGGGQECVRLMDEAIQLAEQTGEDLYAPELHRLLGEALRISGNGALARAESELERALSLARQRDVHSLELRAAASLAQLYNNHGRGDQARRLLEPVYGWFTEGQSSRDLIAAKTLLESLPA